MKRARLTNSTLGVFPSHGELQAKLARLQRVVFETSLRFLGRPEAPGAQPTVAADEGRHQKKAQVPALGGETDTRVTEQAGRRRLNGSSSHRTFELRAEAQAASIPTKPSGVTDGQGARPSGMGKENHHLGIRRLPAECGWWVSLSPGPPTSPPCWPRSRVQGDRLLLLSRPQGLRAGQTSHKTCLPLVFLLKANC